MFLPRHSSDLSLERDRLLPPPKSSSPAFKFSNGFYAPTMSSSAEKFHSVKSRSPTPRKSRSRSRSSSSSSKTPNTRSSSSSSKTPNTRKLRQLEAKIEKLENHLLEQEKVTHDKILTELSQINATQNKLLGACTRTLPKGLPHYTKVGGKKMRRCPIGSRKKCIKKK